MKHGPFIKAARAEAYECTRCGQLLVAGSMVSEGCEGVREGQTYPATTPSDAARLSSIGDFCSRPVQTGVKPMPSPFLGALLESTTRFTEATLNALLTFAKSDVGVSEIVMPERSYDRFATEAAGGGSHGRGAIHDTFGIQGPSGLVTIRRDPPRTPDGATVETWRSVRLDRDHYKSAMDAEMKGRASAAAGWETASARCVELEKERDEWKRRAEFAEARISVGPPDKKLTVAKGFAGWLPDATTEPIIYGTDRMGSQIRHCVVCAKAQPVDDFNMMIDLMRAVGEDGDAEDSYVCDEHAPAVSKALVDMHLRWLEGGDGSNDVDPIDLLADDA